MDEASRAQRENDPVLRAATEWLLELQSANASIERITEWQRWLAADARHQQAFQRVAAVIDAANRLGVGALPLPSRHELAADRYDASVSVSSWRSRGPRKLDALARAFARSRARLATIAASVALLFVAAAFFIGYPRELSLPGIGTFTRVATPAGGTLKVVLADGSSVDVGGESALRSLLTQHARSVTLQHGEAFFHVAKDATRPFTVHAGPMVITAVGTAFNVRRSGEHVVVSVAEGAVRVATSRSTTVVNAAPSSKVVRTEQLHAGEQVSIERSGSDLVRASIDTGAVAGWRDGRLRYLNEPLSSVIADVRRYTTRDIEIADPALGQLRVTGTVLEHNLEGWLRSLEAAFPIRAVRAADGDIRLESRD